MIELRRPGAQLILEPGGALHFGSEERLDVLSMALMGDQVWQVDQSEFTRRLSRPQRTAYEARARGADPLRECHRFMCEHLAVIRQVGQPLVHASAAVQAAYRAYVDGAGMGAPQLALWRTEGDDAIPVIAGGHLKAAFRVARDAQDPAPGRGAPWLRFTHAAAAGRTPDMLAAIPARLRLDAPRPMPVMRQPDWCIVMLPAADLRFHAHAAPAEDDLPPELLKQAFSACNRHYAPLLRATLDALSGEPAADADTPLQRFLIWAQRTLDLVEADDRWAVIQLGAGAGHAAHPTSGRAGTGSRIAVAHTCAAATRGENVGQALPMSWVRVRRDA